MKEENLIKPSEKEIRKTIRRRLKEFEILGKKGKTVFDLKPFLNLKIKTDVKKELLFCISVANSSAISGLYFQKMLEGKKEESLKEEVLREMLKSAGVRFHKKKAEFMVKAIKNFHIIEKALDKPSEIARKIIVKEIKGIGYKGASHFLRNLGRKDVAIIDRHIIRWLRSRGYAINETIVRKKYEEMERIARKLADEMDLNLAEFDLLIWHKMTGKVLK